MNKNYCLTLSQKKEIVYQAVDLINAINNNSSDMIIRNFTERLDEMANDVDYIFNDSSEHRNHDLFEDFANINKSIKLQFKNK